MSGSSDDNTAVSPHEELAALYEQTPCLIAVLDANLVVHKSNADVRIHPGESIGELFRCVSALDPATAQQPGCGECALREILLDTLSTGTAHRLRDVRLPVYGNSHVEEHRYLLSTTRLDSSPKPAVLLTAQDVSEEKLAKSRLRSINSIFASLGTDPDENIRTIVEKTCGAIGGACSLYNRLDDAEQSLCAWTGHNLPEDLPTSDEPAGHICYEATIKGRNRPIILGNLEGTDYEVTDPNVAKYGLKAYIGFPVQRAGRPIGSLCVVDTHKRKFTETDIHIITTLAKGVELEEARKQYQERIQALVDEKELVLKEVHHRIKNDMAVIQSLLSLHADTLENETAIDALREAENRISVMREIYTTLYQGITFGTVAAREYIGRLIENLRQSCGRPGFRFETDIEPISVPVRQAFPLGIIVNELVTNAIKYAFAERESGVVRVRLTQTGERRLLVRVQDDGPGMDTAGGGPTYGFGLRLVETLAQRYNGSFSISGTEGTVAEASLDRAEE